MSAVPIPNVSAPSAAQSGAGPASAVGGTAKGGSLVKIDLGPLAWVLGGLGAGWLLLTVWRGRKRKRGN